MRPARRDQSTAHLLLLLLLLALGMAFPRLVSAAEAVDVYVFWRVGCPHCEHELEYLNTLQARDPDVRLPSCCARPASPPCTPECSS